MEHSKLPWYIEPYPEQNIVYICDDDNNVIAWIPKLDAETTFEQLKANAAFIVHCCNHSDETREALKYLLEDMEFMHNNWGEAFIKDGRMEKDMKFACLTLQNADKEEK